MVDDADSHDWTEEKTRALDASAKLKLTRGLLEMSQGEFAALLGIPVTTLQNWEQRRTEPDAVARTLIDLIYDDPKEMRTRMMRRNAA
ncbi:helix-turn-helix domain-containing protein [Aminobacter sp. P9b]|uniref:Transcriptional regulator n=1 Tax=Aminobacter niigataensis TaxID=83265 RepID=A0ABR6KUV9_9HYPH|nr:MULTISPECIES: helix-turn-helix domain-containing protein [Aminobacter]AWC22926.1 Antitoxin igA-2 [Aminobacter sp. MSH1]MBB4648311.1 putative transcriptional regulator [Aminobacter niigataensis]